MRIKTDYITNSSSSSFVAWGVSLEDISFSDEMLLEVFKNKLSFLETMKVKYEGDGSYIKWYKEEHDELLALDSDPLKIEWANDRPNADNLEILMQEKSTSLEFSDNENVRAVGISPNAMINKFPDRRIGEIREIVADEINRVFGTDFTEESLAYYEEVWFDG